MQTSEQIREKYKTLPAKIRRVLVSPELLSITKEVANTNSLSPEQKSNLDNIISNVLMGFNHRNELTSLFVNSLKIGQDSAGKIASEVEREILNQLDLIYEQTIKEPDDQVLKSNAPIKKESMGTHGTRQTSPTKIEPEQPQIKPYDSFEQTIIRQAMAMQPIQDGSSKGIVASSQVKEREEPKSYIAGNDPYRESIEE